MAPVRADIRNINRPSLSLQTHVTRSSVSRYAAAHICLSSPFFPFAFLSFSFLLFFSIFLPLYLQSHFTHSLLRAVHLSAPSPFPTVFLHSPDWMLKCFSVFWHQRQIDTEGEQKREKMGEFGRRPFIIFPFALHRTCQQLLYHLLSF